MNTCYNSHDDGDDKDRDDDEDKDLPRMSHADACLIWVVQRLLKTGEHLKPVAVSSPVRSIA